MSTSKLADVEVTVLHQTAMAVRVTATGDEKDAVWVPKNHAEFCDSKADYTPFDRLKPKTVYLLTLPEWLALEKGLI